jgi:hypothetical protein
MTSTAVRQPSAYVTGTWPIYAAGSFGIAAVLSALAFYVDVFGPTEEGRSDPVWQWLIVIGVVGVFTAAVFGLVVRPATSASADRRGLVLALVGIPSVIAFWAGLPIILSAAAACCALAGGRPSRLGIVTLTLATFLFGFGAWLALAG